MFGILLGIASAPSPHFGLMSWLQSADLAGFRFINRTLNNAFLDAVMPVFAGGAWFIALAVMVGIGLLWKGGLRGRLFVLMLALVLGLGDALVINNVKKAIERPRPSVAVSDVILHVGKGGSGSMPSSHASTWSAAALIAFAFYPRSLRVLLPLGLVLLFSRVYLGAHYPGDVAVGAILGAGYAAAGLWTLDTLWRWAGPKWFPEWWRRVPSLVLRRNEPPIPIDDATSAAPSSPNQFAADRQFLYLGYVVIVVLLVVRLFYVASDKTELTGEEASHWLWSKHLAFSYHGQPPGIAWLHFLSTRLWGDTHLGVRFFAPVLAALLSFITLRFFAQVVNARAAFVLLLVANTAVLPNVDAIRMMAVAPLALCWPASLIAGWRAVQPGSPTRRWLWVGLWAGVGCLFKYSALLLIPCWAIFFLLWPAARPHLKRPGPWFALSLLLLSAAPGLIANWQQGRTDVELLLGGAELKKSWVPTFDYFFAALGIEAGLLNPIFFVASLWAMVVFWKRLPRNPLWLYFFALSAPVLLGCWAYAFHSRVPPNSITPAIMPIFGLAVAYWDQRWREGARAVKAWLITGVMLGLPAVVLFYDSDLPRRIAKVSLPAYLDPLRPVRAISTMVDEVARARQELRREGKEVFIIGNDDSITGQIAFYLPAARAGLPGAPLAYPRETGRPENQFFFYPEYRYTRHRRGQNAIFAVPTDKQGQPPREILEQFDSVTDLGLREIKYRNRTFHTIQLFACRNLR